MIVENEGAMWAITIVVWFILGLFSFWLGILSRKLDSTIVYRDYVTPEEYKIYDFGVYGKFSKQMVDEGLVRYVAKVVFANNVYPRYSVLKDINNEHLKDSYDTLAEVYAAFEQVTKNKADLKKLEEKLYEWERIL